MNTGETKAVGKTQRLVKSLGKYISSYSFVIIFLVLCAIYFCTSSRLTWNGVMNIFRHSSIIGIIALGMGMVIITGQIDLSMGSLLALDGGLTVIVFNATNGNVLLTILFALAFGCLCGFLNGFMIGIIKMPGFIVTLATMLIYRSLAQYLCHALPSSITGGTNSLLKLSTQCATYEGVYGFGNSKLFTVPMTGVFLIIMTIIIVYIMSSTKYGKKVYAIGSNERSASLSGIRVDWMRVSVFAIAGLLVGVAAFFQVAMEGSVDPATTGTSYEMYAIASVVLGGISMAGGKGRCIGIIFGAMSYTVIDKIIVALNFDSLINDAVKGMILLLAIFIQIIGPLCKEKLRKLKNKK